jgi:hypothetical protein
MSSKHVSAALACGKFKGDTLVMLLGLCHKAGTGKPFKSGKVIPEGEVRRCTDKVLMRALRTKREKSINTIRKRLLAAKVITAERQPNFYNGRSTYPAYVYQVNLERLLEMAKNASQTTGRQTPRRLQNLPGRKRPSKQNLPGEKCSLIGNSVVSGDASPAQIQSQVQAAGGLPSATAAQRSARGAADSPTDYQEFIATGLESLKQNGWNGSINLDLITEIAAYLERIGIDPTQIPFLFAWITEPKQSWILRKTRGRFDWLRDRIVDPQNLDRSLVQQFLEAESERREPVEGSAKTFKMEIEEIPESESASAKAYLEGEVVFADPCDYEIDEKHTRCGADAVDETWYCPIHLPMAKQRGLGNTGTTTKFEMEAEEL